MNSKVIAIAIVAVLIVGGVGAYLVVSNDDSERVADSYDPYALQDSVRLNICGNANMDSELNQKDVDYIQDIIDGKKDKTKLADTNNDGDVTADDITALKKIISLDADKIWYLDVNDKFACVEGKIGKIAMQYWPTFESLVAIGAEKMITHTDNSTLKAIKEKGKYGEAAKALDIKGFGSGFGDGYDFETILSLGVDAICCGSAEIYFVGIEDRFTEETKINMIRLPFWEGDLVPSATVTLAWLLQDEQMIQNAEDYIGFHTGIINLLKERTGTIEEKKTCLVNYYSAGSQSLDVEVECRGSGSYECSVMAGLDNLSSYINTEGVLASDNMYYYTDIEYVLTKDPDCIIMLGPSGPTATEAEQKEFADKWSKHLEDSTAYKNKGIIVSGSGTTSGLYQSVTALILACQVYPDAFKDVDANAYLQELIDDYTMFNDGLTSADEGYYDVDKTGSFVYVA